MAFQRTLQGHIAVDGAWVDISSDIRQNDGATITIGGMDEQRGLVPAKCVFTLNNRHRDYSPHNPKSIYYRKLGQNTLTTLRLMVALHDFGATTSNGWSAADPVGIRDTTYPWTLVGTAADFAEGSGAATISLNGTNIYHYAALADVKYETIGVLLESTVAINDITGGPIEPGNILFRGVGTNPTETYYMVRVSISASEVLTVALMTEAGTVLAGPVTVSGVVDAVSSKTITVRAECEGDIIRVRVWKTGTPEPTTWHLTDTDRTYKAAGWVAIRDGVATGNTNTLPIVFSHNRVEVYSPQYCGEVAKWPPSKSREGADRTVRIEAFDLFHRRRQGQTPPAKSALRSRFTDATVPPVAYWPCEDSSGATSVASDSPADPMHVFGGADFGSSTVFACSAPLPVLSAATFTGRVPTYTPTAGQTQIRFLLSVPAAGDANGEKVLRATMTGGSAVLWDVVYNSGSGGSLTLNIYGGSGLLYTSGAVGPALNGVPSWVSLEMTQDGADIDFQLFVLGTGGTGGGIVATLTANTYNRVDVLHFGGDATFTAVTVGHITVDKQIESIVGLITELRGYVPEEAHQRIERLSTVENVTAHVGSVNTHSMGAQPIKNYLDQLEECAIVDLGGMGTCRGENAIRYTPLRYFYNQTPAVVLDAAGTQLDEFTPDFDNFLIRNKIRVKRSGGSEYTATATAGRLAAVDTADGGVGIYEDSPEVNMELDTDLPDQAGYRLLQGTIDKPRVPDLSVNLANPEVRADETLTRQLIDWHLWQRSQVENADEFDLYDTVDLLTVGLTITLSTFTHRITANCVPYDPYRVLELDNDTYDRLDIDGSTLAEALDASETGVDVSNATPNDAYWGTDTPYDIDIGGERMTVTSVSGTGATQTLTVTRNVNGLPGGKTHSIGDEVHLADPVYYSGW